MAIRSILLVQQLRRSIPKSVPRESWEFPGGALLKDRETSPWTLSGCETTKKDLDLAHGSPSSKG